MECTLDALFPSPGAGLDSHEQPQIAEDSRELSKVLLRNRPSPVSFVSVQLRLPVDLCLRLRVVKVCGTPQGPGSAPNAPRRQDRICLHHLASEKKKTDMVHSSAAGDARTSSPSSLWGH